MKITNYYEILRRSFEISFYRQTNPDLININSENLFKHYCLYGIEEGREMSRYSRRENFHELFSCKSKILEIGPFNNPLLVGSHVDYFDVLNQDELKKRAVSIGIETEKIPFIKYVSPNGDLSIINDKYDFIVSAHLLEHQTCLIRHFNIVENLLKDSGAYYMIVPDKRFCFDHFLPESTIADVLHAFFDFKQFHTCVNFMRHRLMLTHNDPVRHWQGDHGTSSFDIDRITAALVEFSNSLGKYIDVHAFQFTPSSICNILLNLKKLKFINLKLDAIYPTPKNRLEFLIKLSKES